MSVRRITCPMCGHLFDPDTHAACQQCPLNRDCSMVCCPVCGYETVDTRRSTLARIAARLLGAVHQDESADPQQSSQNRSAIK